MMPLKEIPLVSILISAHNGEATLDRCFESIQKQTFQNFSIVCVDDASSDKTPILLGQWEQRFGKDRFTILANTRNKGLTQSLNMGLQRIQTTYTARIDIDDWWDPTKLEKQIAFLDRHKECGVLGSAYTNIGYGKQTPVFLPETDSLLKKYLFYRNPFAHSSVIFRTDLIKKFGGYDNAIRYGQDYELWLRVSAATTFANIPEILCFRNADSGISCSHQNAQMWQYIKTQCRYIRKLRRSSLEYRFVIIPFLTILTPPFIRLWKRKWL